LSNRFLKLGMAFSFIPEYAQKVIIAIENTLLDEHGQWILKKHLQAESELPLTIKLQEKTQSIIIDRTFIDDNNIRWIVDFKTTTPDDMQLNNFLEEEV